MATSTKTPPADSVSSEQFYADDERRRDSHVLSYGSGWTDGDWNDDSHVIELEWFGATHEIVAYYITYDWDRLAPGRINRDEVEGAALEILADSGQGVGRILGDMDTATSDVHMRVLGVVHSDLQCHELLWDWHWIQHHKDGLAHVAERIREHSEAAN
jgi:hypothetical protein